jgi:hypothetical protein
MNQRISCALLAPLLVTLACSPTTPPSTLTPQGAPREYFYFSSDHDAGTVLSTPESAARLEGARVIAGVDPAGELSSTEFRGSVEELRADGRGVHVYLEGPGGPTGDSWASDECERIHRAAVSVGLTVPAGDDCGNDGAAWMKEWNESGFLRYLEAQLQQLARYDIYSVEVDNLARAGYGAGRKPLSEFIASFSAVANRAGSGAKLLLKNVETTEELSKTLAHSDRKAIADYLIVEEYLDDQWCDIAKAARAHDIQVAFSWDTNHFHAEVDDRGRDLVLAGPKQSARKSFRCEGD